MDVQENCIQLKIDTIISDINQNSQDNQNENNPSNNDNNNNGSNGNNDNNGSNGNNDNCFNGI